MLIKFLKYTHTLMHERLSDLKAYVKRCAFCKHNTSFKKKKKKKVKLKKKKLKKKGGRETNTKAETKGASRKTEKHPWRTTV